jgi:hypothetical protein
MKNMLKTLGLCGLLLANGCATLPPRITSIAPKNGDVEIKTEYKRSFIARKIHPTYSINIESADNVYFNNPQIYPFGKFSGDKNNFILQNQTNNPCFYRVAVE